jgi:hypothetical protein
MASLKDFLKVNSVETMKASIKILKFPESKSGSKK